MLVSSTSGSESDVSEYDRGNLGNLQGSHRLEKYLNMQDCLEKSLKIKFALKST